jgi:hypothetical protein
MGTRIYLPMPMKMFYHSLKLVMFMLALAYKIEMKTRCHNMYQEVKHVQGYAILML